MRISVVIPLYNKRTTLVRAINSVFDQIFLPEEIIVVNDGSTDGSEQIVIKLNNPKIKLYNQPNQGVSSARNKGIREAMGDWIAFLDADDEWMKEYLETITLLSEKYPQCSVLASSYFLQDYTSAKKNIILKKLPFTGESGILSNYFEIASISHPPLWTSAVVVRKSALESIGGFPVGVRSGEDLLTWARLAIKYSIAYTTKPNSIFIQDRSHELSFMPTRLHDENDFVENELKGMYLNSSDSIKKDIRKYISHWYKMKASVRLRVNDKKGVWQFSLKALKYNFLNYKIYAFLFISIMPMRIQRFVLRQASA